MMRQGSDAGAEWLCPHPEVLLRWVAWHGAHLWMLCSPILCGGSSPLTQLPNCLLKLQISLGAEGLIPLEIRFLHNPWKANGFVGAALSSNVIHIHKVGPDGRKLSRGGNKQAVRALEAAGCNVTWGCLHCTAPWCK